MNKARVQSWRSEAELRVGFYTIKIQRPTDLPLLEMNGHLKLKVFKINNEEFAGRRRVRWASCQKDLETLHKQWRIKRLGLFGFLQSLKKAD